MTKHNFKIGILYAFANTWEHINWFYGLNIRNTWVSNGFMIRLFLLLVLRIGLAHVLISFRKEGLYLKKYQHTKII